MSTEVKWNDREITNPVLRAVALALAIVFAVPLMLTIMIVMITAIILTLPLQPLFWLFDRRGFIQPTPDGGLSYTVDRTAFRKREELPTSSSER